MNPAVLYESIDQVAVVTINRPEKRNAINEEVEQGLADAWRRFSQSEDRVAILTGAGANAFSAGKDLKSEAPSEYRRFTPGMDITVEKPIIAAVAGWCVGGAVTLVMMCDLCIAAENARFLYPEAHLGFAGGVISALAARIPHKVAMGLIIGGEELSAERAYQVGFVNKVVPKGEHLHEAMVYARRIAASGPLVVRMLKKFADETLPKGPIELASHALREVDIVLASEDAREGRRSFREKRKPQYMGK